MRILYALREEMPAGGDPGRPEGKDLGAGRRKMRGVRDMRGSMPEESDRNERVKQQGDMQMYISLLLYECFN